MSTSLLPPNPCLLAILFVAKIDSESKIIFHYPPRPGEDNSEYDSYFKRGTGSGDDEDSSSDGSSVSSEDDALSGEEAESESRKNGPTPPDLDLDEAASASPEKTAIVIDRRKPRWSDIFGYSAHDLANILTPHRSGHKKRFEVGLYDKTLLGWPLFSKNGTWRRRKIDRRRNSGSGTVDDLNESQESGNEIRDDHQQPAVGRSRLEMFHVVFVMNPPLLEHHLRIKHMYEHITKKLSKALKWEHAQSGYILQEASAISKTMMRYESSHGSGLPLAPLYHEVIKTSSLAKAITNTYDCISTSRIAHLTLSPTLSISLQIPTQSSISTLPSLLSPQQPGLWLTTAASLSLNDDSQLSQAQVAAHFGLLLLCDPRTIFADMKAIESPLLGPLTHYLRISKPTKSFLQISQISGIALTDIQFLASHLIHWRRALAIPPLNKRNTYIMSPNADVSKLASASASFAKKFPTLPSLPKILSMLSYTPRPFNTLIPSPHHKEAYLEILAYLFQGGWVTQLRSVAWIRVPAHVRQAVDREEREPVQQKGEGAQAAGENAGSQRLDEDLDHPLSKSNISLEVPAPPSPTHSINSRSSTHTAIPLSAVEASPSKQPPLVIPQPRSASSLNTRYLSAVSRHVLQTHGSENQHEWDRCVKYFDGKHALGVIVINEGWKRRKVADLMNAWEKEGLLVRGRHW